ncbi:hypothetical protein ACTHGU_07575 [Chitinophagaceae bacterium MMS25-I14]
MRLIKTLILFLPLLLFAGVALCQDSVTKYIVIDSLVLDKKIPEHRLSDCRYLISEEFRLEEYRTTTLITEDNDRDWDNAYRFFHVIIGVRFRTGTFPDVNLRIDDKGSSFYRSGGVVIKGIEKTTDTVRISKWNVYHNSLRDSFKGSEYRYIVKDSTHKMRCYGYRKINSATKETPDTIRSIVLFVNNRRTEIPLNIKENEPEKIIEHYCPDKENMEKYLKGQYPYKQFVSSNKVSRHYYTGKLEL